MIWLNWGINKGACPLVRRAHRPDHRGRRWQKCQSM